jgi:penicillin-binding protein 1C
MLAEVSRPDMPDSWRLTLDRPAAAWKTGTSFGHRDAWAVGFGRTLAVGVWVGNPDGSPVKGISGAAHAGPLFFDVLRALAPHSRDLGLAPGPGLRPVRLCASSGLPAGPDCPLAVEGTAGPRLALPRCTEHRRVMVDARTGLRLEGGCLASPLLADRTTSRVAETVPPELAAWLASQGKPVPALPALSPLCPDVPGGAGPVILSPSARTPYVMRHDAPASYQQLALKAVGGEPDQPLWWYVDGRFAGTARGSHPLFWTMVPGRHTASVTDAQGRSETVAFRVLE